MIEVVFKRLGTGLSAASQLRLREMMANRRQLRPREELARQGETACSAYFVLEGLICRHKIMPAGRRAVLAYLLPGDFCGPHPDFCGVMDHGIASLTAATVAEVPHHLLQESLRADPAVAAALASHFWTQFAIQRQWLANMSSPSDKRLAHLLCEMRARLAQVDLADARGFFLNLTQHELSEAAAISTVHVNRVLQHLKDLGLVRVHDRRVMFADLAALEAFAEFDGSYLQGAAPSKVAPHLSIAE